MRGLRRLITVRRLVFSLGLLGLSGVVAVGGVYGLGSIRLDREQDAAALATDIAQMTRAANVALLEARQAETDFLLRNAEAFAHRHAGLTAKALEHLDAIEERLGRARGGTGDLLPSLRGRIQEYRGNFTVVAAAQDKLGLDDFTGLRRALRMSVREIDSQLAEADEKNLTIAMLLMRQNEKDFVLQRDAAFLDAVKRHAQDFAAALETSTLTGTGYASVKKAIEAYQNDLSAFAQVTLEQGQAASAAGMSYAAAIHDLDQLRAAAQAQYASAQERFAAIARETRNLILATIAGALILMSLLGLAVARAISGPIAALSRTTERLSQGDLDARVEGTERRDELGTMARALQVFKEAMQDKTEADRRALAQATEKAEHARRLTELTQSFEAAATRLTRSLADAAGEMEATARTMSSTAGSTNAQVLAVASSAEQTSANVRMIAVATEQLSASAEEIGTQVGTSARIAEAAVGEAQRTNATVGALSEGAQRIGDVVKLINEIAEKTNLLALNATIEAARAGEAGKGFAVVASEVKDLAGQTARATSEIAAQIDHVQGTTREAVRAIQSIDGTISRIHAISTSISSAAEDQAQTIREIARNIQEAARGTQQVTTSVVEMERGAGETGQAAERVLDAARQLSRRSEELSHEVAGFVSGVRAA